MQGWIWMEDDGHGRRAAEDDGINDVRKGGGEEESKPLLQFFVVFFYADDGYLSLMNPELLQEAMDILVNLLNN